MLLEQRTLQTTWKQAARQSLCNAGHSVNNKTNAEEEEDCKLELTKYITGVAITLLYIHLAS
jgi:hypothetical protein